MLLVRNASQLVCVSRVGERLKRGDALRDLAIIPDGSLLAEGDRIRWVGPTASLPPLPPGTEILDATGKVVLPGWVDSHTHLLFAGTREDEFEQRLQGATYQEISARGGGINATVRRVRQCSRRELVALARPRLRRLLAAGVTTAEVKSGYGLTLADEVKSLEAVADLDAEGPLELVPTFLGAHAVPPEFAHDRAAYVRLVADE